MPMSNVTVSVDDVLMRCEEDRFYSAEHMAYIDDACDSIERGETISFDSMDELEQAVKERMQCA